MSFRHHLRYTSSICPLDCWILGFPDPNDPIATGQLGRRSKAHTPSSLSHALSWRGLSLLGAS